MFTPSTEHMLRPGDLIPTGTYRDGRKDRPESMLTRDVLTPLGLLPVGHIGDGYSTPALLDAGEPRGESKEIPNRLHDWLLELGQLPREIIDDAFAFLMREADIGWWKRTKYWIGVRAGSWSGYGKVSALNLELRDQYLREPSSFLGTSLERAAYQRTRLNRLRAENGLPPVEEFHLLFAEERWSMDLHVFFHGERGVRNTLFKPRITKPQVDGCERIIKAFTEYWPNGTLQQLAYILATSYHETGRRMQPVREAFGGSDEQTIARLDRAWEAGELPGVSKPYWREGYFGRGDVQLTHKANYEGKLCGAVKSRFGVDIAADPALVLRPDISAYILIEGMRRGDTGVADFTSQALEDHVNATAVDYVGARRVVNPGDKPSFGVVAGYAQAFENALKDAGWGGR